MSKPNPTVHQFSCLSCGGLFDAKYYEYGDTVVCPCGAVHETDNDYGKPVTLKVISRGAPLGRIITRQPEPAA